MIRNYFFAGYPLSCTGNLYPATGYPSRYPTIGYRLFGNRISIIRQLDIRYPATGYPLSGNWISVIRQLDIRYSATGYPSRYPGTGYPLFGNRISIIRATGYMDIRQIKLNTGYQKRPDMRPARYQVQLYSILPYSLDKSSFIYVMLKTDFILVQVCIKPTKQFLLKTKRMIF